MRISFLKQAVFCAILLLALGLSQGVLHYTMQIREAEQLSVNPVTEGVPPQVVIATTALGGFRGIFIDLLWLRAMSLKEDGQFFEMIQVYDWITTFQPNYSMIWRYIAWDFAYNVSVEQDLQDRWFWVYRGIRYLRDKGIPLNRLDPELYSELSYIYFDKIGGMLDYAHQIYKTELARMMDGILQGPGDRELLEKLVAIPLDEAMVLDLPEVRPFREKLAPFHLQPIQDFHALHAASDSLPPGVREYLPTPEAQAGLEKVRLYLIKQRLVEEQKLDPARMLELNEKYGPIDWRGCDAHALYWGYLGNEIARNQKDAPSFQMAYERMFFFSIVNLVRRNRVMITEEGVVYNVPDFRFMETVHTYMMDLIERATAYYEKKNLYYMHYAPFQAYITFLREAIYMNYANGRMDEVERYYKYFQEFQPDDPKLKGTAAQYIQGDFEGYLENFTPKKFVMFLEAYLRQHYFYLSLGDRKTAADYERQALLFYQIAQTQWPQGGKDAWKDVVPPLADVAGDLLVRILNREEREFTPSMVARLEEVVPADQIRAARNRFKSKMQKEQEQREKALTEPR
ncbi:MAG: hypothetical protein V1918_10860 [Planctomycetota bacterium]